MSTKPKCGFLVRPPGLVHMTYATVPYVFRVEVPKNNPGIYRVTAQLVEVLSESSNSNSSSSSSSSRSSSHQVPLTSEEEEGKSHKPVREIPTGNPDTIWWYFVFKGGNVVRAGTWKWRMRVYREEPEGQGEWTELVVGKDSKSFEVRNINRIPNEMIGLTQAERKFLEEEGIEAQDPITLHLSKALPENKRLKRRLFGSRSPSAEPEAGGGGGGPSSSSAAGEAAKVGSEASSSYHGSERNVDEIFENESDFGELVGEGGLELMIKGRAERFPSLGEW